LKKANPTVIGAFVLGAIALLVVALATFGSGKLLSRHPRAVAFFEGNISGLSAGSAVNLRGVQVGTVSNIQIRLDLKNMRPVIPVYIELDPSRFHFESQISAEELAEQQPLKDAIAHGLHARLATQSLVTGQLVVELDLDPDEPRQLTGADPTTVEIPTSVSDLDKLKNALTQLPLDKLATSGLQLLQDADKLVTSEDVPRLLRSLVSTSDGLDRLISDARRDLPSIVSDLRDTMKTGRDTLDGAQSAVAELRTAFKTANQLLATDVREAVRVATGALQKSDAVLSNMNGMISVNSSERYDIDQALRNLTATTRSLRIFAEDLERRPNSVIVGK
jgi:paraquat-inducible protein B